MHYNAESKSNTASMCGRIHSQSHKFFICVDHHRWQTTVAVAADTSTIVVAHAVVCLPFASSVKKKNMKRFSFVPQPVSMSSDIFGSTRDERMPNDVRQKDSTTNAPRTFNCRRKTIYFFFSNFQPYQNKEQFTINADAIVCVGLLRRQHRPPHRCRHMIYKSHTNTHHDRCSNTCISNSAERDKSDIYACDVHVILKNTISLTHTKAHERRARPHEYTSEQLVRQAIPTPSDRWPYGGARKNRHTHTQKRDPSYPYRRTVSVRVFHRKTCFGI